MTLLDVLPPHSITERIGDQFFSVGLLLTISWLLWQRITKVQDRMDTYLNEDRKEMGKVIENNTRVMEEVLKNLETKN